MSQPVDLLYEAHEAHKVHKVHEVHEVYERGRREYERQVKKWTLSWK
jgi:hypothetical protein